MDERERDDPALARLVRAVRAEPDPAPWTRARARLEAAEEPRGLIAWLMRPAALATSIAALAIASALTVVLLRDTLPASYAGATGLTDALLGVERSPVDGLEIPAEGAADTPADSGVSS